MASREGRKPLRLPIVRIATTSWLVLLATVAFSCSRASPAETRQASQLRLAISTGQMPASNPYGGLKALALNFALEPLIDFGEDGRPLPRLIKSWSVAKDGLSVDIELRPGVTFHDQTPVSAQIVAQFLERTLPRTLGPIYQDVGGIKAAGDTSVLISLKRPTTFFIEALETALQKPGAEGIGTGAFELDGQSPNELRANSRYYLGAPGVERITLIPYRSVRAAWADLLRDQIDMLYDVGVDSRDSLEKSSKIAIYPYVRHYQYIVVFNPEAPSVRSPAVRRALNAAVDRDALIKDALNGHAVPSVGPLSPRHWAFSSDLPTFRYNPQLVSALANSSSQNGKPGDAKVHFTCLVAPDADWERVALVLKRQLAEAGVSMDLRELPVDQLLQTVGKHDFDAYLIDGVSGPQTIRPYLFWHSKGSVNYSHLGTPGLDDALDRVRTAASDDEYRAAVANLQRYVVDNPPGIFLAWGERVRARTADLPFLLSPALISLG